MDTSGDRPSTGYEFPSDNNETDKNGGSAAAPMRGINTTERMDFGDSRKEESHLSMFAKLAGSMSLGRTHSKGADHGALWKDIEDAVTNGDPGIRLNGVADGRGGNGDEPGVLGASRLLRSLSFKSSASGLRSLGEAVGLSLRDGPVAGAGGGQ
ncbi:unnamed protein product, partial [Discosporangium mesarthrocarpum]